MIFAHAKTSLALLFAAAALLSCNSGSSPAPAGSLTARLPHGALPAQPSASKIAAAPAGSTRDQIAGLLDGYEDTPSKQALLAHADESAVAAALASLAQDASQPTIHRLRAVSLLGLFPGDATGQALESALAGSDLMRREATTAYANAFGQGAIARLTALASHDDPFTRIVAIQALGRLGSAPALAAIEARAQVEPAQNVRQAARRALASLKP